MRLKRFAVLDLRLLVGLAMAMVLVAAVACGDDDEEVAAPAPAPTAAPAAPAPTAAPAAMMMKEAEKCPGDPSFAGESLTVSAYSGPFLDAIRDIIAVKFEEDTGGKVNMIPTSQEGIATILAAPADNPPFDVTAVWSPDFLKGITEELFVQIRRENVPHMKDLIPFHASNHGQGMDVSYGVPFEYAYIGMMYNKKELGFVPETFEDLFRPEAQGKIQMSANFWPISMSGIALATDFAPFEQEFYTEEGLDALMLEAAKLDVALWSQTGAESTAAMERGDVALGIAAAESVAPLMLRDPDQFGLIIQKTNNPGWIDYFSIVRGTKHLDMAECFLNYMIDPVMQGEWAEVVQYWMSNENVEYGPEALVFLPPTHAERIDMGIMMDWPYIMENWDPILERITREVMTK